jgi:hypothetical protein
MSRDQPSAVLKGQEFPQAKFCLWLKIAQSDIVRPRFADSYLTGRGRATPDESCADAAYFFFSPARLMLLMASGGRPDFSAIS